MTYLRSISRTLILITLTLAAGMSLLAHTLGDFDPVKEILQLKEAHRRDDAADLADFLIANQIGDQSQIGRIQKDLAVSPLEKLQNILWEGGVKGVVFDFYSGMGALASDLCVWGDVRDLSIQAWRYVTNQTTDALIALLSGIGVALSGRPFLDGVDSLAKSTVKYSERIGVHLEGSILRRLVTGKLSREEMKTVWELAKKTSSAFPVWCQCSHMLTISDTSKTPWTSSVTTEKMATPT